MAASVERIGEGELSLAYNNLSLVLGTMLNTPVILADVFPNFLELVLSLQTKLIDGNRWQNFRKPFQESFLK